jgi:hypothetical protein
LSGAAALCAVAIGVVTPPSTANKQSQARIVESSG